MRLLSSRWTFFYKFIFPTLWIGALGSVTLAMYAFPDSFDLQGEVPAVRELLAIVTLVGACSIFWSCVRVKRVSLDGDTLIVSNYRSQVEVPLRYVEDVSGSILMSPELVWLRFRRPTPFGTKIVFMPEMRVALTFTRHPLVAELRARIGR